MARAESPRRSAALPWFESRRYLCVMRALIVLAVVALLLGSCTESSCACVMPVPSSTWVGVTSAFDSLDLALYEDGRTVTVTGTLHRTREPSAPVRGLQGTGERDLQLGAPIVLTLHGWYDTPVTWRATVSRRDSLYGVLQLPVGQVAGDTLGLFLRRRR